MFFSKRLLIPSSSLSLHNTSTSLLSGLGEGGTFELKNKKRGNPKINVGFKCAGVEIHSFRSQIRDHFVLEWKSTLKIVESTFKLVESTLKRVIQTITLEWVQQ